MTEFDSHDRMQTTPTRRTATRVICALVFFAVLAACSDKEVEEPAELVDFDAQLNVKSVWSRSFGGDSERLRLALKPAVVEGVVYGAGYDGKVMALRAENGRKIWSTDTELPLSAGPAAGEGVVVSGATDGTLIALDAKDGKERWRTRLSSEVLAPPVVAGGLVLVRTVDGRLSALTLDKPDVKWAIEQQVPRLSLRGTAPPTVAGDTVYAGFDNGRVVAIELASGDTQWETVVTTPRGRNELERLIDIDSPVRPSGEDILVMGFQGRVAMLARDSGQIWWARDFSSYRGFVLQDDIMYATGADGAIVAMRRSDGSLVWENTALRLRGVSGPAIDGTALVVGDFEGYLHWLNLSDGTIIARKSTGGERITNSPQAVDGRIYVQDDSGQLNVYQSQPKKK